MDTCVGSRRTRSMASKVELACRFRNSLLLCPLVPHDRSSCPRSHQRTSLVSCFCRRGIVSGILRGRIIGLCGNRRRLDQNRSRISCAAVHQKVRRVTCRRSHRSPDQHVHTNAFDLLRTRLPAETEACECCRRGRS